MQEVLRHALLVSCRQPLALYAGLAPPCRRGYAWCRAAPADTSIHHWHAGQGRAQGYTMCTPPGDPWLAATICTHAPDAAMQPRQQAAAKQAPAAPAWRPPTLTCHRTMSPSFSLLPGREPDHSSPSAAALPPAAATPFLDMATTSPEPNPILQMTVGMGQQCVNIGRCLGMHAALPRGAVRETSECSLGKAPGAHWHRGVCDTVCAGGIQLEVALASHDWHVRHYRHDIVSNQDTHGSWCSQLRRTDTCM